MAKGNHWNPQREAESTISTEGHIEVIERELVKTEQISIFLVFSRLVVSGVYLLYQSSSEGRAGNKADEGFKVHGKD